MFWSQYPNNSYSQTAHIPPSSEAKVPTTLLWMQISQQTLFISQYINNPYSDAIISTTLFREPISQQPVSAAKTSQQPLVRSQYPNNSFFGSHYPKICNDPHLEAIIPTARFESWHPNNPYPKDNILTFLNRKPISPKLLFQSQYPNNLYSEANLPTTFIQRPIPQQQIVGSQ